jgi:hypothetical protein
MFIMIKRQKTFFAVFNLNIIHGLSIVQEISLRKILIFGMKKWKAISLSLRFLIQFVSPNFCRFVLLDTQTTVETKQKIPREFQVVLKPKVEVGLR